MVVKMFPSSDSHLKLDVKVNVCGNGKNFDGNLHEANYKNLFLKMRWSFMRIFIEEDYKGDKGEI